MKVLAIIALICMFVVPAIADDIINPGKTTHEVIQHSKVEGVVGDIEVEIHKSTKVSGEHLDLPEGPVYRESPPPILLEELTNPNDPTSAHTSSLPYEIKYEINKFLDTEKEPEWFPDWDADILIHQSGTYINGIDMDEDDATDDIYVIVDLLRTTPPDTQLIYRSTDGGETWNIWSHHTNSDGTLRNPKVRIARDASGVTWVCSFGIWYEPTGEQRLYMRRMKPDLSSYVWEMVNDTVDYADADADIGDGAWVYVTYSPTGSADNIYAARNYMDGTGWKDDNLLFANPQTSPYAQIAAGVGGTVAVTFVDNRFFGWDEVRIKRSTNYGSTWIGSEQVSNNTGHYAITYTDIAYSHISPHAGSIISPFYVVDNNNLVYHYSTNSGVNWTYGGVISPASGDETKSTLRALKSTSIGGVTVAYKEDDGDSVMFTWADATSPSSFTTPERISDAPATGIFPPVAGWIYNSGTYSAIIYSRFGPVDVYFDWFGNTAIEEKPGKEISAGFVKLAPNPSRNLAKLTYIVQKEGNVKISLYDATGRSVDNLVNEAKPAGEHTITINTKNRATGIYFLKVKTPEATYTKQMTIIK